MALAVNTRESVFGPGGEMLDCATQTQLAVLAEQVMQFSQMKELHEVAKREVVLRL